MLRKNIRKRKEYLYAKEKSKKVNELLKKKRTLKTAYDSKPK